jgi:LPXTG-motif cell wall-anchored protein
VGVTGTKSPSAYTDVDINVTAWTNSNHGFDFTISGLAAGEYVDISVKYGNSIDEAGPYGNGSHSYSNSFQNAISHVRLCVFEETTTTTEATTTTTEAEETTTTEAEETTTTTVEDTTTTTVEDTTTTTIGDEVLPTVITTSTTAAPTTTAEDEVLDTEVLPFTGGDNDMLALLAGGLGLLGALVLASTRRMEEN